VSDSSTYEKSEVAANTDHLLGPNLSDSGRCANPGQPLVEFPLTPSLSPRERENNPDNRSQSAPVEKLATCRTLSPLPEGEGQGERETEMSSSSLSVAPRCAVPSRLRRVLFAPIKFFWGMALCQSVIGALAVLGWTYRLMQRSVLKQW